MEKYTVPKATLGRLPLYLSFLQNLPQTSKNISATVIAKELSLGEVQVRKDLAYVSGLGKPKVGYVTSDLVNKLESCLGYNNLSSTVLVGAGKLGRALLDYDGFEEFGIKILAAFDCDENIINNNNSSKDILPMHMLEDFCTKNNIQIGIITVGKNAAQEICDKMIGCGIKAIWNFAPCRLNIPDNILLKQENLALSLAYLNNQLSK